MSKTNKEILEVANAFISKGDIEGFLGCCSEDIIWKTIGESTIIGKAAVRRWMVDAYKEPPEFNVTQLIADADYVVAVGEINAKDEEGNNALHSYCDVWRFREGKMTELMAYVIKV